MDIRYNISLKPFNTFNVDVTCERFVTVSDYNDIALLFENNILKKPFFILGEGSNVLFINDFKGTIIQMTNKGIEIVEKTPEYVLLKVAAGERWEDFVNYCLHNKYYGVENLIGIPGFVGSSPVQNIGAYSVEAKDVIERVNGYFTETGTPFSLHRDECDFSYRNSIFKNKLKNKILINEVVFRLSMKETFHLEYKILKDELEKNSTPLTITNVASTVLKIRNSKLPDISKIGSAGSFFKNPVIKKEILLKLMEEYSNLIYFPVSENEVKLAAGQLIELAGWKGKREGDVGVFPLQALVIVNYGNANGKEILSFYKKIQNSVQDKFGVTLEPEVNIILN